MKTNTDTQTEFLRGWIAATNHDATTAREQWAGYCRQCSDAEIELIECGGFQCGFEMGTAWKKTQW